MQYVLFLNGQQLKCLQNFMLNASALVKRSPCVFIEAEAVIHSSPRLLYTGLGWID